MTPSPAMLEAARSGFPEGSVPQTERESVHRDLVRANVLIQALRRSSLLLATDADPEFHDLAAIHAAIGRAQEFLR